MNHFPANYCVVHIWWFGRNSCAVKCKIRATSIQTLFRMSQLHMVTYCAVQFVWTVNTVIFVAYQSYCALLVGGLDFINFWKLLAQKDYWPWVLLNELICVHIVCNWLSEKGLWNCQMYIEKNISLVCHSVQKTGLFLSWVSLFFCFIDLKTYE